MQRRAARIVMNCYDRHQSVTDMLHKLNWPMLIQCIMMHKFINICDQICKKGSYTRTTSEHKFHHHTMDTSSDNPCVHVLWPADHQSAFPEAAFSDVHECPVCAQSSLLAVQLRPPGYEVSHDLVVILSTD